jgi:hypothetical protein
MRKVKIVLFILILCFLTSCSPITRASGNVTDSNNMPLDNVKVKINGKSTDQKSNLELSTKSDGHYDFGEIYVSGELPVEIKLIVSKEGFKTFTKDLKSGENNVDKIILEREQK